MKMGFILRDGDDLACYIAVATTFDKIIEAAINWIDESLEASRTHEEWWFRSPVDDIESWFPSTNWKQEIRKMTCEDFNKRFSSILEIIDDCPLWD